jgi:hypothetical protein
VKGKSKAPVDITSPHATNGVDHGKLPVELQLVGSMYERMARPADVEFRPTKVSPQSANNAWHSLLQEGTGSGRTTDGEVDSTFVVLSHAGSNSWQRNDARRFEHVMESAGNRKVNANNCYRHNEIKIRKSCT